MPSPAPRAQPYPIDDFACDGLPPHRAAVPLPPVTSEDAAGRRRFPWRGVLAATALHCAFLAVAVIWGQGDDLPAWQPSITVELVDSIGPTVHPRKTAGQKIAGEARKREDRGASPSDNALVLAPALAPADATPVASTEPALPSLARIAGDDPAIAAGQAEAASALGTPAPSPQVMPAPEPVRASPAVPSLPATAAMALPSRAPALGALALAERPREAGETPPLPARPARLERAILGAGTTTSASVAGLGGLPIAAQNRAKRMVAALYQQRIRRQIQRYLPAGEFGPGYVAVGLRLSRSGRLLKAYVQHSSGNSAVDRAALHCVRAAQPYPAIPPGIGTAQLGLSIPFRFE